MSHFPVDPHKVPKASGSSELSAEQEQLEQLSRERQQLQQMKGELELRVAERTAELMSTNRQLQAQLQERKRVEQQLRISWARFEGIVSIAGDAIISIDQDQKITLFNQGAETIFGYREAEVLGKSLDLLLPQRYVDVHHRHVEDFGLRNTQAQQMGGSRAVFGRRKDGSEFPAEASISQLKLGDEIIFTIILRDVTRQHQDAENLERLSHQNELILNAMVEGLCGLDQEGKITFLNASAAHMLGYSVDELIGKEFDLLSISRPSSQTNDPQQSIQPHRPVKSLEPIYQSLKDGTVHRMDSATFYRKNSKPFPVEYWSTPIIEQQRIMGVVVTFRDVSDRQVVKKMQDEFVSVVSHELRTPLASIHGSLKMLASGLLSKQPDKSQRLLQIASESTERLVRLINDILDIERIESGKIEMHFQACNLSDLVRQASNTMETMALKTNVRLEVEVSPVRVWVDPDRILQTLTNLLSNAIKFSPANSTIKIRTLFDRDASSENPSIAKTAMGQEQVLVMVEDQGRGIAPDKLDHIFERFQQADSSDSRNFDGTGLGLAICKRIIQQHQGQIWVKSRLGEGSCFYFTLPLKADS